MSRIIINNKTEIDDIAVIHLITSVMARGRISNDGKQFAYLVTTQIGGNEYHIVSDLRAKSDSFTFYKVGDL